HHQAPMRNAWAFCAKYSIVPQLVEVSDPSPRKDRPASDRMPVITENRNPEAISGNAFGMISLTMIRTRDSPVARAASTKSRRRSDIVWARSTRADPAQEVIAMTTATEIIPREGR